MIALSTYSECSIHRLGLTVIFRKATVFPGNAPRKAKKCCWQCGISTSPKTAFLGQFYSFFLADMWLVCQQLVAQKQEEATPVRPFHAVFEPHHSVTPDRYGSEYGQNILYPKKEASSLR